MNNGLCLSQTNQNAFASAYLSARNAKQTRMHDFQPFGSDYSFYITAPGMIEEGMLHTIPSADRSETDSDVESELMGMIIIQLQQLDFLFPENRSSSRILILGYSPDDHLVIHSNPRDMVNSEGKKLVKGDQLPDTYKQVLESGALAEHQGRLLAGKTLEFSGLTGSLMSQAAIPRSSLLPPSLVSSPS